MKILRLLSGCLPQRACELGQDWPRLLWSPWRKGESEPETVLLAPELQEVIPDSGRHQGAQEVSDLPQWLQNYAHRPGH